ncbi:MAG TPA: phytase, partial [Woeseiaceae bacterium]|nr:phytase [Woeseiaceae bacterium]
MSKFVKLSLILNIFLLFGCSNDNFISAIAETEPVATSGDAADDPAIVINFINPTQSIIFGTDKRAGVYSYDLSGKKISYAALGEINNIDVRQIDKKIYVAASNRTAQSIEFWEFNQQDFFKNILQSKNLFDLAVQSITIPTNIDVYGICVGLIDGVPIVFITEDKGPRVELWVPHTRTLIGSFSNGGESEGCVFDDENKTVFISEEEVNGVLKAYNLNNEFPFEIPFIVDSREGNIGGDPEGLTIYKTSEKEGYLLLSSQGDNKYNVYNRSYPHKFILSFTIDDNPSGIDGTSETDGIDVT